MQPHARTAWYSSRPPPPLPNLPGPSERCHQSLACSQFVSDGMILKALGSFPAVYDLSIFPMAPYTSTTCHQRASHRVVSRKRLLSAISGNG